MPSDSTHAPPSSQEEKACPVPEMAAMLIPYALSRIPKDKEEGFEAHLLGCDACFENLRAIDRTRTLIKGFLEQHIDTAKSLREVIGRQRLLHALACWTIGAALAAAGFVAGRLL